MPIHKIEKNIYTPPLIAYVIYGWVPNRLPFNITNESPLLVEIYDSAVVSHVFVHNWPEDEKWNTTLAQTKVKLIEKQIGKQIENK